MVALQIAKTVKREYVAQISRRLDIKAGFALFSYADLNGEVSRKIRKELRETGASLQVVPNGLFLKALKNAFESDPALKSVDANSMAASGAVAVIHFGTDPIAAAKLIYKLSAADKGFQVSFGVMDGAFYDATQLKMLSELGSKDELRGALVGTISAPLSQFVGTLDALLSGVIHCLRGREDKLREQAS